MPIKERVSHPRRDEDVLESVVVKVAGGDAPRPKSLHSGFIRYFLEAAFAEVLEEGISEQNVLVANLEGTRGLLAVLGEDVPIETRALG